jgi:predicted ATPase/DNA-binding CsgD family transcriptional regulator
MGRTNRSAGRHNLPLFATSFLGREREIGAIRRLLRRARLVTLCGPGGCGNTRLAIEAATRQVGLQPDGTWLVDLAPLSAPEFVPEAAASVLRIRAAPDQPTMDALVTQVADRRLLLVLDGCEHLVDACSTLAAGLVAACPGVRLLATSRQPLDVAGEVLWRVPPLAEEAAVRLFDERARSHHAGFEARGQRAAVAEICRRLDGMPLAIELAAARVTMMSPAEMLPRLRDRFALLGRGSRGALPRQQSLKAAVDYSYELLDGDERQLFRQLSVFAGSFSLAAAEAIFGPLTLEVLGRLIDKSMVTLQLSPNGTRYRLLETLREYGRQRLAETGESERAHNAHLEHFVDHAETAYDAWVHSGSDSGLRELELDYDDLRAALEWSRTADPEAGLRLAGAMREVWYRHGLNEGRAWLQEFLDRCPAGSHSRARALLAAGYVAMSSQAHHEARELLARSRELSAELSDAHGEAMAAHALGVSATLSGSAAARGDLERGLELFERLGDRYGISASLIRLGHLAILQGRRLEEARVMLEWGLQLASEVGDRWGPGAASLYLGVLAGRDGQPEVAEARLRRSLEIFLLLGEVVMVSAALIEYAAVIVWRDPRRGARLVGAAVAIRRRLGGRLPPIAMGVIERTQLAACDSLGPHVAEREAEAGGRLSIEEAVAEALAPGSPNGDPAAPGLSRREAEVASLVAQGLTNRQIAELLRLSERTVENHASHILNKLGLRNRSEVTAWVLNRRPPG